MIRRISRNFVEWCHEVLDSDEYILLDTETTGLGSADQICELAIIGTSCEVLYNKLLRPLCPIGEGAMQVHRITEQMVREAPSFADEWPQIERAIGGRKIITWNAAFDARMIWQSAKAHSIILKDVDYYCAMLGYTDHYGYRKWQRLTQACSTLGIDFQQDHRALGDVRAVREIIRAMARKTEPQRPS